MRLDKSHWPNPHFAVIFSYEAMPGRGEDYEEMDRITLELAAQQPGYLGHESVNANGRSIFISYWRSREDIAGWQRNDVHRQAKAQAHKWYTWYQSTISEVFHRMEYPY